MASKTPTMVPNFFQRGTVLGRRCWHRFISAASAPPAANHPLDMSLIGANINMMTAAQFQELADHYKALSQTPGISTDRAFILKNIARSLAGLASQLDRLAALMRDEAK